MLRYLLLFPVSDSHGWQWEPCGDALPGKPFEAPWKAGNPKAAPDDDFHGMAPVMNSLKADKRPFTLSLSGRGNFRYVFPVLSSLAIIVAGNP